MGVNLKQRHVSVLSPSNYIYICIHFCLLHVWFRLHSGYLLHVYLAGVDRHSFHFHPPKFRRTSTDNHLSICIVSLLSITFQVGIHLHSYLLVCNVSGWPWLLNILLIPICISTTFMQLTLRGPVQKKIYLFLRIGVFTFGLLDKN